MVKNELESLENRAEQMERRVSDTKDRNLGMTQVEERSKFRVKNKIK